MVRRIFAAAVLVVGLAAAAEAQDVAAVRGVVHDAAGRPMPGAVVMITHPATSAVRVAVTDLRGEYVVRGLEPGVAYRVQISHPQFRKHRIEARAYAAERDAMAVRLKPRRAAVAVR